MTPFHNAYPAASLSSGTARTIHEREEVVWPVPSGSAALSTAGVVHDLGNLIQVAASVLNIISRTPDMPTDHRMPLLARAKTSLDGAGALVRQTIGGIRGSVSADADTSMTDCLADVAALIGLWEAGFSFEVAADLPAVRCDPIGLRSALLNLVFNAREATGGNGVIWIVARSLSHDDIPTGVELRVCDDGIGMSEDTIARAFDPFFTTKSDGLGGVALPMVERFVREAGGQITIESEPGIGTNVILRLPAAATSTPKQVLPSRKEFS